MKTAAYAVSLVCVAAFAQNAPPDVFEVASVKPNHGGTSANSGPGQYAVIGITLQGLVMQAYGIKRYQYAGPSWTENEKYNVVAKMAPGTTGAQRNAMIRNLLTERFHLQLHREQREMAVYDLLPAKGGPKLQPPTANEAGPPPKIVPGPDRMPVIPPGSRPLTTTAGMGG